MEDNPEKILKNFGLLMGGVFSLITLVLVYKGLTAVAAVPGGIAAGFIVFSLAAPLKLAGVHERWMKFSRVLGNFNAKLILGIIHLVVFSLVRFVFLIIGKDPMKRKFDPEAESYWENHEAPDPDPKRYEKQY